MRTAACSTVATLTYSPQSFYPIFTSFFFTYAWGGVSSIWVESRFEGEHRLGIGDDTTSFNCLLVDIREDDIHRSHILQRYRTAAKIVTSNGFMLNIVHRNRLHGTGDEHESTAAYCIALRLRCISTDSIGCEALVASSCIPCICLQGQMYLGH